MNKEEKGIYCVKGYGTIKFIETARANYCPISGTYACVECEVITKEEAFKKRQIKKEEK